MDTTTPMPHGGGSSSAADRIGQDVAGAHKAVEDANKSAGGGTLPQETPEQRQERLTREKAAQEAARKKADEAKFARGTAVRGEHVSADRKERLTSDSPTPFGAELEYRLWRKMRDLQIIMGDISSEEATKRGLDISLLGKAVLDQAPGWNAIAQGPEWVALGQTLTELDGMDEQIRDFDVRITKLDPLASSYIYADAKADLEEEKADLIRSSQKQRETWEKKKTAQIKKLEEAHTSIFGNLETGCDAFAFLSQQRVAVAEQIGITMTNNGTKDLNFTLPTEVQIDEVLKKGVPPEDATALKYLRDKLGLKGKLQTPAKVTKEVFSALCTLTPGTLTYLGLHGLDMGGAGPWVTGGAVVATTAGAGALVYGRRIKSFLGAIKDDYGHWKIDITTGKSDEGISFNLSYIPRSGGALPENTNNPITRHFTGEDVLSKETVVRFLEESEKIRAEVATCLRVDTWMVDLGGPDVNQSEGRGMDLIINDLMHQHKQKILDTEYEGKEFTVLSGDQQREVLSRAYDLAAMDYGGEELRSRIKNIALRQAQGRETGQREGRASGLTQGAKQLKDGKYVVTPQEEPKKFEEVEAEKNRLQDHLQKHSEIKARLGELRKELDTAEKNVHTAEDGLRETLAAKGKRKIAKGSLGPNNPPADIPGVGEIGDYEREMGNAEARRKNLIRLIGEYKTGTGNFTGLRGQVQTAYVEWKVAAGDETAANNTLKEREGRADKLEKQLGDDEAEPAEVYDQKSRQKIPNPKKLSEERKEQIQIVLDGLRENNQTKDGTIAQAKKNYEEALRISEARKARHDNLNTQLTKAQGDLENLNGLEDKDGSIASYTKKIRAAEKEIRTNEQALTNKTRIFDDLKLERNRLLVELGFSVGDIPSDPTIDDKIQHTQAKVKELEVELQKLKDEAGKPKIVASKEDLERADGMELASRVVTDTTLNRIIETIINGNIRLEDLANTLDDRGYRLILEQFFGPEALMEGKDGKYQLARKLVSKSMLAEAVIDTWHLEKRMDDFLENDPQLAVNYGEFRSNQTQIRGVQR
ncbi:hypothetical protein MUP32_05735, partial [Candidatus Microgenomates bacterium]|nr:hypothetical protein [Candidatus Microgenomates bacterium]